MNPAHTFDTWSPLVGTLDHITSADAQSDNVDNAGLATMPWLVAFEGEDSLVHARRAAGVASAAVTVVAAVGPVGSAGEEDEAPHNLTQLWRTHTSNPARLARTNSNRQGLAYARGLPISFYHAWFLARNPQPNPFFRNDHPPSASATSAEVTPEPNTAYQTLEDLRALAAWLRLRDPTVPDPIVGAVESDPAGVADELGVKGLSVYSSFFELETLQCRVCGDQASETGLALLHQRHKCHLQ